MESQELSSFYMIGAIIMASVGTALTRFLPFIALRKNADNAWLKYLQDTMPLLIMTLLVFLSLKDTAWSVTYGTYEILGIACVIMCFMLSKNAIFSMFIGIICYMFLIHLF